MQPGKLSARLAWFVALWTGSVLALGLVSLGIKAVIG